MPAAPIDSAAPLDRKTWSSVPPTPSQPEEERWVSAQSLTPLLNRLRHKLSSSQPAHAKSTSSTDTHSERQADSPTRAGGVRGRRRIRTASGVAQIDTRDSSGAEDMKAAIRTRNSAASSVATMASMTTALPSCTSISAESSMADSAVAASASMMASPLNRETKATENAAEVPSNTMGQLRSARAADDDIPVPDMQAWVGNMRTAMLPEAEAVPQPFEVAHRHTAMVPEPVPQHLEVAHRHTAMVPEPVPQPLEQPFEVAHRHTAMVPEASMQPFGVAHSRTAMVPEASMQPLGVAHSRTAMVPEVVQQSLDMAHRRTAMVPKAVPQPLEVAHRHTTMVPEPVPQPFEVAHRHTAMVPEPVPQLLEVAHRRTAMVPEASSQLLKVAHSRTAMVPEAVQQPLDMAHRRTAMVPEIVQQSLEVAHRHTAIVPEAVPQPLGVGHRRTAMVLEVEPQPFEIARSRTAMVPEAVPAQEAMPTLLTWGRTRTAMPSDVTFPKLTPSGSSTTLHTHEEEEEEEEERMGKGRSEARSEACSEAAMSVPDDATAATVYTQQQQPELLIARVHTAMLPEDAALQYKVGGMRSAMVMEATVAGQQAPHVTVGHMHTAMVPEDAAPQLGQDPAPQQPLARRRSGALPDEPGAVGRQGSIASMASYQLLEGMPSMVDVPSMQGMGGVRSAMRFAMPWE